MFRPSLIAAAILLPFLGTMAQAAPFEKLLVYQDKPSANHFVASGFMPDGKCVSVNDVWLENCHEGRSCIKAEYKRDCSTLGSGWAGLYWLNPANNWGDNKGGIDLTGAARLVFWARAEKAGSVITFKMGGIGVGHTYPDTDAASSEPITLTQDWKEYSIDLTGKNLSRISGGFAFVGTAKENQSDAVFYLDDIYYE